MNRALRPCWTFLTALALVGCGGFEPPPLVEPGAFIPLVCGPGWPEETGFACDCLDGYYDSGSLVGARCIPWGQAYDDEGQLYGCVPSSECGRPEGRTLIIGCGPAARVENETECVCLDGAYDTDDYGLTCEWLVCGENSSPLGHVCTCGPGYYPMLGSDPVYPTCLPCRDGASCNSPLPSPPPVQVPGVWTSAT